MPLISTKIHIDFKNNLCSNISIKAQRARESKTQKKMK